MLVHDKGKLSCRWNEGHSSTDLERGRSSWIIYRFSAVRRDLTSGRGKQNSPRQRAVTGEGHNPPLLASKLEEGDHEAKNEGRL